MFRTARTCLPIIVLVTLASGFGKDVADSQPVQRSVIVNVFDTRGSAISDLTREDFQVRLNGKSVAVLDARYSTAPRRIVVLLDMSGSMTGQDDAKWKLAREAVSDLLLQTPKAVPIAVLTFTDRIHDAFNFSQSRGAIAEWLNGPGQRPVLKFPRTALFDSILEGLKMFGPVQPGDALYAITDGGDNASRKSEEQTKAALLWSRVRLFAFLFAPRLAPPHEREERDLFLTLVVESGGYSFGGTAHGNPFGPIGTFNYVYDDDSRARLRGWTEWLNLQVNGFWTLDLAAPPPDKKRNLKVEIISREGKVRKDVGVTYPRLLSPQR